jgi:diguanylate cyclase (GGDEF)-like protein
MNIEVKSQFNIAILFLKKDLASDVRMELIGCGFSAQVCYNETDLLEKVKNQPPHLVVFHPEVLSTSMNEFMQSILNANNEVLFLSVAPPVHTKLISEFRPFNLKAFVPEGESLTQRIAWQAELVIESLYASYQNEKLLNEAQSAKLEKQNLSEQLQQLHNSVLQMDQAKKTGSHLFEWFEKVHLQLSKDENREDLLQSYFQLLAKPAIFLKNLPTLQSVVLVQGNSVDWEPFRDSNLRLSKDEIDLIKTASNASNAPMWLKVWMGETFRESEYQILPLSVAGNLVGVVLTWGSESLSKEESYILQSLFILSFEKLSALKMHESKELLDTLTNLYNRKAYYLRLEEEVARASRVKQPLCVLKLCLDRSEAIEKSLGRANMDVLVRNISQLLKKSSRLNDSVARTDDSEFSLILSDSNSEGALIRADRLRQVIAAHKFVEGLPITISCGISEYPKLSKTYTDLDSTTQRALRVAMEQGGNQVCVFSPDQRKGRAQLGVD